MKSLITVTLVNKGIEDIKNKIMRCTCDIEETFNNSQSRYFRMLRFVVKYDLTIEEELEKYVRGLDFDADVFVG